LKKKQVLFVCTGNSVRSQMAEAILKKLGDDQYQVFSAGSHPAQVHELTKETLRNNEIHLNNFTSNQIDEFKYKKLDYVIVLCEVAYHYLPDFVSNPEIIKWFMDDPINIVGDREKQKRGFQIAFREIKDRIHKFFNLK